MLAHKYVELVVINPLPVLNTVELGLAVGDKDDGEIVAALELPPLLTVELGRLFELELIPRGTFTLVGTDRRRKGEGTSQGIWMYEC